MLEFVFIQDLDFREILRKGPGEHPTYGSVDILRREPSEIGMNRYYKDQRTRRTILPSSTDKKAGYENRTRQPASRNLYRVSSPSP